MLRLISIVSALSLLSACASVDTAEVDVVDPLKYPADMQVQDGYTPYPIPSGEISRLADTPRPVSLPVRESPQIIGATFSIRLTKDGNGTPMLVLTTDYTEAWERLLDAVKSSRYGLADLDRSTGVLYLDSWVGKEPGKGRDVVIRRQSDRQYQLQLIKTLDDVQVTVQIGVDELATPEDGQRILEEIRALLDS